MSYDEFSELCDPKTECPNIEGKYERTSDPTIDYNCLAWALGYTDRQFDPDGHLPGYFWPAGIAKNWNVPTILKLLSLYGYSEMSESASFEPGYLKIAIYVEDGEAAHFARQLASGEWTSKLGDKIDIRHVDLECLEEGPYGRVETIVKKAEVISERFD
jgi:hypothetical protein